jgi:hypothetical protein
MRYRTQKSLFPSPSTWLLESLASVTTSLNGPITYSTLRSLQCEIDRLVFKKTLELGVTVKDIPSFYVIHTAQNQFELIELPPYAFVTRNQDLHYRYKLVQELLVLLQRYQTYGIAYFEGLFALKQVLYNGELFGLWSVSAEDLYGENCFVDAVVLKSLIVV